MCVRVAHLRLFVYVCMCVIVCVCVCVFPRASLCVLRVPVHACVHIFARVEEFVQCQHACAHACKHACLYARARACVCVVMCVHVCAWLGGLVLCVCVHVGARAWFARTLCA